MGECLCMSSDTKKTWISAYIPSKLKAEVVHQAGMEDRSVSATVGRALRHYLKFTTTNTQGAYHDRVQAGSWREYE